MMGAQLFDFALGPRRSWAQGHQGKRPTVTLRLVSGDILGTTLDSSLSMSLVEARAMAAALLSAIAHAEANPQGAALALALTDSLAEVRRV